MEIYVYGPKKLIRTKWTDPLPPFTPVTVLLIAEKPLSLWFWNSKYKIKCNSMSGLFCIEILLKVGRFFFIWILIPSEPKWSIPTINVTTKLFLQKGHWNLQKAEKQRKNRTKVCNLTKISES